MDFRLDSLEWLQINLDHQPLFRVPWKQSVQRLLGQFRNPQSAQWQCWMSWFEPLLSVRFKHELQALKGGLVLPWSLSPATLAQDFIEPWLYDCRSLPGVEVWDSQAWLPLEQVTFLAETLFGRGPVPCISKLPEWPWPGKVPPGSSKRFVRS